MGQDTFLPFPPAGDPNPVVVAFFQKERAKVMAEPADPERRNLMLSKLVAFLKEAASTYGFPWSSLTVAEDTSLVILCSEQRGGVGPIMSIQRLQEEYLTGKAGVVILMRDESNPISETSTSTLQTIDSFRDNGGHFVAVSLDWLADFEALVRLRREVTDGRLPMPDGTPVEMSDVIRFMETGFRSGLLDRLREILAQAA